MKRVILSLVSVVMLGVVAAPTLSFGDSATDAITAQRVVIGPLSGWGTSQTIQNVANLTGPQVVSLRASQYVNWTITADAAGGNTWFCTNQANVNNCLQFQVQSPRGFLVRFAGAENLFLNGLRTNTNCIDAYYALRAGAPPVTGAAMITAAALNSTSLRGSGNTNYYMFAGLRVRPNTVSGRYFDPAGFTASVVGLDAPEGFEVEESVVTPTMTADNSAAGSAFTAITAATPTTSELADIATAMAEVARVQ